jgi:hypothetical protein
MALAATLIAAVLVGHAEGKGWRRSAVGVRTTGRRNGGSRRNLKRLWWPIGTSAPARYVFMGAKLGVTLMQWSRETGLR